MHIGKYIEGFGEITSLKKMEGYGSTNFLAINCDCQKALIKIYSLEELDLIKEEISIINQLHNDQCCELPHAIGKLLINFPEDGYFTRISTFMEGRPLNVGNIKDELLISIAKAAGKLLTNISKINSPLFTARVHDWNLRGAYLVKPKIRHINDPAKAKLVKNVFLNFESIYFDQFLRLRQGLIHGDLNEANIIVEDVQLSGFIDFGDMSSAPLVCEVAILMTYIMMMFPSDCIDKGKLILSNFNKEFPFTEEEIEILPTLIALRLAVSVCNSAEQKATGGDTAYILMSEKPAWTLLEELTTINPLFLINQFKEAVGLKPQLQNSQEILEKRIKFAAPSLSLSYSTPILMQSALFQYMYDGEGNTFLDAYNNIPHVGHSHPRVVEAGRKQMGTLNTNTRYLYNSYGSYSELLLSHFPPLLGKVLLVNSGSEASDLATRIARTVTGKKGLAIVQWSYHGNTQNGIQISSYKFDRKGGKGPEDYILTLPLPKAFNGTRDSAITYFEEAKQLIEQFETEKYPLAAFIAEPISGCGGQVPLMEDYLKLLTAYLRSKGILIIIDEVQTGFGRLGHWFWGFEMHDIVPDMVVLGKPMGNGHPMGGVVTTEEITHQFNNGMEFFSSFGGNPVSCEIGKAVLETIKEENLQENARIVGEYWKDELMKISMQFPFLADVRGKGLFIGVECLDANGHENTSLANRIKNELRNHFILASTDGPLDNVLKMKPPLCFSKGNVDHFCISLKTILLKAKL